MMSVDGFTHKVVRFIADILHLIGWGQLLLLGPSSILVAHTKDEFVLIEGMEDAVRLCDFW